MPTKQDIFNKLKANKEVNTIPDDFKNSAWPEAFELFNSSKGMNYTVKARCQKCFSKVLEWLQS